MTLALVISALFTGPTAVSTGVKATGRPRAAAPVAPRPRLAWLRAEHGVRTPPPVVPNRPRPRENRRALWPSWWLSQALCVHDGLLRTADGRVVRRVGWGEGPFNYNGQYEGGFSFMHSTWEHAVRTLATVHHKYGYPDHAYLATPRQQLEGVYAVWLEDGDWHEWPQTSRACGLR